MRDARTSIERALFFGLPAFVLVASYVAVAIDTGHAWAWMQIAHESGDKTLLDTLLYFDHAARELPGDLVLGVAVAGAMIAQGRRSNRNAAPMLGAWVAVVLVIFVGSASKVGVDGLVANLTQMYTRPGAPPDWGAHWRYHFLSRLGLVLMCWWAVALHRWWFREAADRPSRRPYVIALAAFGGLSLVFIPTLEPFFEPRFLGHQAREAMTHAIVTVPLALGLCYAQSERGATEARSKLGPIAIVMALSAACVVYVGLGAVLMDASGDAQSKNPVRLVATHFYEHGFTYLVTPFFAAWLHRLWSKS